MDSEYFLDNTETLRLNRLMLELNLNSLLAFPNLMDELGLEWAFQQGRYIILDEKRWMLGKIKYGI